MLQFVDLALRDVNPARRQVAESGSGPIPSSRQVPRTALLPGAACPLHDLEALGTIARVPELDDLRAYNFEIGEVQASE